MAKPAMIQEILLKLMQPLATLASGVGKRKKLFILIYHRVLDEPDVMRPGEVDKTAFTWQMRLLAKYFNVLPLHEALDRMHRDRLPPRAVTITFDDGYADNYTNALPILQQFGLTATFFIANGFLDGGRMWNDTVIEAVRNYDRQELDLTPIGLERFAVSDDVEKCRAAAQILRQIKHLPLERRDQHTHYIAAQSKNLPNNLMMTTEQLIQLHRSGMEIGGHTVNHPILAKLDEATARREIGDNKAFLEKLLNTELRFFAYPNGKPVEDYSPNQVSVVRECGYNAAVSTRWGVVDCNGDRWQLPRFTPWDSTPARFMLRLVQKYFEAQFSRDIQSS